MGRGRGVARREGGAQQAGPPSTHARARAPTQRTQTPRDGLADPHPSRAPRARRRTARSAPGSREEVGDHAHASARAAARRGRRSPTPRGGPDVRAASERRTAVPGPGDSRARAAAAPAHASGRGPGPGRGPAPSPAGGRGRRGGARHSTAKGKATAKPAGAPAPPETGDRDRGRGPRTGPHPPTQGEGRATGQAEVDLHTHRTNTCPGGTTGPHSGARTRRTGRRHAGRGQAFPPPDADNARDHTPRGRATAGPGSEAHPVGGGRAPTRCGRAGRDKTRRRARQAAKRGGGAPGDTSGAADRHQDARGGLTASSLRARRRPRVAPGAADQALQRSLRLPHRHAQSHAARAPGTRFPPHAPQGRPKPSGRPPGRHRPGPEGARRGYADTGPTSVAGGGDAPRRRSRVRAQTGRPTA